MHSCYSRALVHFKGGVSYGTLRPIDRTASTSVQLKPTFSNIKTILGSYEIINRICGQAFNLAIDSGYEASANSMANCLPF